MRLSTIGAAVAVGLAAAGCGFGGGGGGGDAAIITSDLNLVEDRYLLGLKNYDSRLVDMDCDGVLDIVAMCTGQSSLAVAKGLVTSAAATTASTITPVHRWQRSGIGHTLLWDTASDYCVGDFNRDGIPDVAVCGGPPVGGVVVFQGDGTAAYFNPKEITVDKAIPWSKVASGDVNGDGTTDLVVLAESTGTAFVCPNDPSAAGSFLPAIQLPPVGGPCHGLSVAFIIGNDRPTITTCGPDAVALWKLTGGTTVALQQWTYSPNRVASSFGVVDMNGDGRNDVVVAAMSPAGPVVSIFEQDRNEPAGFRESPSRPSLGQIRQMAVGDFDRDGRPDVVGVDPTAEFPSSLELFLNDPAEPSGMKKGVVKFFNESKGFGVSVAAGDVNGDGYLDLVVADGEDHVRVLTTIGSPPEPLEFEAPVAIDLPLGTWVDVQTGDVDGDGRLDIVVCGSMGIGFCRQDATAPGGFTPPVVVPVRGSNTGDLIIKRIALGDVDGDGRLDVAFASRVAGKCGVLWNDGGTPTRWPSLVEDCPLANDVALGDVNGDGSVDLVVVNAMVVSGAPPKGGAVDVRLQVTGNVRSGLRSTQYPTGSPDVPLALSLSDVDCDGKLDVVCANSDDTLSVLLHVPGFFGPGSGDLLSATSLTFAGGVRVAKGDVNGDGRMDLATVDSTGVALTLQRTTDPRGQFLPSHQLERPPPIGDPDFDLLIADFDRDGRQDVCSSGHDSRAFSVWRNDATQASGFREYVVQYQESDLTFRALAGGDLDGDGKPDVVVLATSYTPVVQDIIFPIRQTTGPVR